MKEEMDLFKIMAAENKATKAMKRPGMTVIRTKVTDMQEAIRSDRNKYIGGSDAAAIFGMNPWKSAYALWCEKTGKISGEKEDNDAMRTGRDLEQYVAQRFQEATGKKVQRDNYKYTLEEYPFMVGHIDRRVLGENAILECKTANSFQTASYENGKWPAQYYVQCQHYMAVTGADRVYLGVLCFPHFYWTQYDRNDAEIDALLKAEQTFWDQVESNTPPEIDASESTQEALNAMYPNSDPDFSLRMGPSQEQILEELEEINSTIKDLQDTKAEMENKIKSFLGEAEAGVSRDWKVTWKTQSTRRIDAKRLQMERPDIYEHYTKVTESRVLRRKKIDHDRS